MSDPRSTERPLLTRARIGVLMGGQSAERDVSLRTGAAVHRSLVRRGYNAVTIDVGPTLAQDLRDQKIDLVFLALHGPGGEDGAIQGFLETLGIPYTGSGIQASAIGMHKVATKTLLASARIPVPAGTVVKRGEKVSSAAVMRAAKLRWPVVVKPASQGSTIGVTIVQKPAQWNETPWPWPIATTWMRWSRPTFRGMRSRCRSSGGTDDAPLVLPAVEIVAPGGFYDFAAKYEKRQDAVSLSCALDRRRSRADSESGAAHL